MSYKSIDPCLKKALEDEILFVLMARDPTAPEIVRAWAKANVGKQPKEKIQEALQCADEMEKTCANINARKNTLKHRLKKYQEALIDTMGWVPIDKGNLPEKEILAANFRPGKTGYMCKNLGYLYIDGNSITCEGSQAKLYNCTHYIDLALFDIKPEDICKKPECNNKAVCEGFCAAHCNCKA